jgi:hypothetical protein
MGKRRKHGSEFLRFAIALAVCSIAQASFSNAQAAHKHRTHSYRHYAARTEDDPLYMDYRHDARAEDDPLYMEDFQPPEDFYRGAPSGRDSGYDEQNYPPWDYPDLRWAPGGPRSPSGMGY